MQLSKLSQPLQLSKQRVAVVNFHTLCPRPVQCRAEKDSSSRTGTSDAAGKHEMMLEQRMVAGTVRRRLTNCDVYTP